ncbi:MAG: Plug domain-containing protein, partial [Gammaproteobacteria bacterium]|nr:Plug domain-containing protein [Gammaproteobacteria bacterium]
MKTLKLLFFTLASVSAAAQDADYELSTTAMHTIRSQTALPVTILSGKELRDATRATIGDTLSNQPGISNASFGPAVGQPVIRGQQGRRVMNLSNAVPNADASGNSADHAVSVEPILADAIEVLRGPSTLLYGGGGIGGVVNIIDNRIPRSLLDTPVFNIEARHDSAADQDTVATRLEFNTGNFAWHLDGVQRQWKDLE